MPPKHGERAGPLAGVVPAAPCPERALLAPRRKRRRGAPGAAPAGPGSGPCPRPVLCCKGRCVVWGFPAGDLAALHRKLQSPPGAEVIVVGDSFRITCG